MTWIDSFYRNGARDPMRKKRGPIRLENQLKRLSIKPTRAPGNNTPTGETQPGNIREVPVK